MDIDIEWLNILEKTTQKKEIVFSRGMPVVENICFKSKVDMKNPILLNKQRSLSYSFMCGEAYWILSGDNRLDNISKYNKVMSSYSDDGVYLSGAYGPPIVEQIKYIKETLIEDQFSRQAVLTTWRVNPRKSKDIPCTVSSQFIVRENEDKKLQLNVINYMRSSDLWLGWPYDIFSFSMLARLLNCQLNNRFEIGNIYIVAGSSHIYCKNIEKVDDILKNKNNYEKNKLSNQIPEFNDSDSLLHWLKERADKKDLIIKS